MIERVIVAGGGTGGHLFPGIAVIEELRRRRSLVAGGPELAVTFVGTSRGIESRVIPARGESLELIEVSPLKGRSPAELMRSLMMLPGACSRSFGLIRKLRPDLVIGVGGYASGPMLLAATALGVPTAILEQNAHVGLTNRVLAPLVGRAYVAFAEAAEQLGAHRVQLLGNPVRRTFVEACRGALSDPSGFEARANQIFVLGGSQGARVLNQVVPAALAKLGPAAREIPILHQSGKAMRAEVEEAYRALGLKAQVVEFVDDMARAYAGASVVIARAGATTLAEVCAIGRPSVLVPYPHAADDHQAKNAEALERAGAAVAIRESALSADKLAFEVGKLLEDTNLRRDMADAARRHGRPEAAAAIVDDLSAWLGGPAGQSGKAESTGNSGPSTESGEERAAGRAVVDFRAGRTALALQRRRQSRPPPAPAYLQRVERNKHWD